MGYVNSFYWNAKHSAKLNARKSTKVLGLLLMSFALLTGLLVGGGPANAIGATISLAPTPLMLGAGGNGFVDVMVSDFTSTGGLGAYALAITYDQSVVEVTSVDEGDPPFAGGLPNVGNPSAGGPFINIDNTTGEVRLVAFQGAQLPGPVGNIRVARINFQAVGALGTSSQITIDPVASTLIDAQSGDIVSATLADGSVSIVAAVSVSGATTLQFRSITEGRALVAISCPSLSANTVPADDGTWQIGAVPAETCTLTATAPGYLKAEGQIIVSGADVAVPANELLAGDVLKDGTVDFIDVTTIISLFVQPTVDCEIDGKVVDWDCGGVVDLLDITRTIANFLKTTQPFPTS